MCFFGQKKLYTSLEFWPNISTSSDNNDTHYSFLFNLCCMLYCNVCSCIWHLSDILYSYTYSTDHTHSCWTINIIIWLLWYCKLIGWFMVMWHRINWKKLLISEKYWHTLFPGQFRRKANKHVIRRWAQKYKVWDAKFALVTHAVNPHQHLQQ